MDDVVMDACTAYENDLAKLLADEVVDSERARLGERLRGHARGCPSCSASFDLVEVLALPAQQRGGEDDPGPDYWAAFNARVRRRIGAEDAVSGSRRPWLWGAVAAAVVFALFTWSRVGRETAGPETTPLAANAVGELPPALVETLVAASPAEIDDEVDSLTELQDPELFSEIDGLSAEEKHALLRWLRSQAS